MTFYALGDHSSRCFSGQSHFFDVCPGKLLSSNGTPFCPVFHHAAFLTRFSDFEEITKRDYQWQI